MKHLPLAMSMLLAAATLAAPAARAVRDPFARPALPPPAPTAEQTAALAVPAVRPQLRAIMLSSGQALANINGRILAVGDWFGDYQVVRIRERSVTLAARGGAKSELALDRNDNQ